MADLVRRALACRATDVPNGIYGYALPSHLEHQPSTTDAAIDCAPRSAASGLTVRSDSADVLFYPSSMPVLGILVLGQTRWLTALGAMMYCSFVGGLVVPTKVSWCRTIFGASRAAALELMRQISARSPSR